MGIQQLPLPVCSQWWNSPKIPMLDKELAWEFYKTQTKELNIFSCAIYNLPPHFPAKHWVRFEQNVLNCLIIYQRLSVEMHKQMIQTLRKSLMAALASKLQLQGSL